MCNNVKRFFDKLMAPPYSYSTSFSHSVLAASALWAMVQYYGGGEEFKFGYAGLGLILIQGCAGMWRYGKSIFLLFLLLVYLSTASSNRGC